MSADPLVLGIDPGLGITGYGVLHLRRGSPRLLEAGVIRCNRTNPLEQRLLELHGGICEVLAAHPGIQAMAMEQLYSHYDRPRTAILMGHARGVLCLAASQAGLAVCSYLPTRVKKSLTGNGHAPKSQVQHAVQQQLGLSSVPEPPDVADALAVALCHYFATRNSLVS
jgi:crossover junction endodeoxyribonuclease RuvC